MLHLGVVTLMPAMFSALQHGVVGRAIEQKLVQLNCWNPRDWAELPYRQVDDRPYGGGPGMVMRYEPVAQAIEAARGQMPVSTRVVYLSPQGKRVNQALLNQCVAAEQSLLFVAGRYEGIDERLIETWVDEEWSLGDFVLSGGEMAAMAFIDALVRLVPGSLGHQGSAHQDSFMEGLLDYPHYTRPAHIDGKAVPAALLSGNHREIEYWRRKQALGNTWLKRPDLLEKLELSDSDRRLLAEFKREHNES